VNTPQGQGRATVPDSDMNNPMIAEQDYEFSVTHASDKLSQAGQVARLILQGDRIERDERQAIELAKEAIKLIRESRRLRKALNKHAH